MNSTWIWSNYSVIGVVNGPPVVPYSLTSRKAVFSYESGSSSLSSDGEIFLPIPQLRREDAQVTLLFLTNYAAYWSPVHDPFFETTGSDTIDGFTYYYYGFAATVLGCAEQYEICNPKLPSAKDSSKTCIVISDPSQSSIPALAPLKLNHRQRSTAIRLLSAFQPTAIHEINHRQQGLNLLANNYVYELSVAGLPPDQWIKEINHWFGTMVNLLQLQSLSWIAGPNDPSRSRAEVVDIPEEERWMCDAQIMRRDDYASFSVLGLALILIVGGGVAIVSFFLGRSGGSSGEICVEEEMAGVVKMSGWSTVCCRCIGDTLRRSMPGTKEERAGSGRISGARCLS